MNLSKMRVSRLGSVGSLAAVLAAVVGLLLQVAAAGPVWATSYGPARGEGSSYAALAFQQWVDDGQVQGIPINYQPNSSPTGLNAFSAGQAEFAGTEAEFSSLTNTPDAQVARGFEYTPDVAGAIAVMYHINDQASRQVTYLHLSQRTVARIFMGYISNWSDSEITADNLGAALPSVPITVIFRSGQSGTTALFYDFVKHADPTDFAAWAQKNNYPTQTRIIQLDTGATFAPLTEGLGGSDQEAEAVSQTVGAISYDEFSYAKVYGVPVAWIQNGSGTYTQPYALNIVHALAYASLNPDLSQNLDGVYTNPDPLSYPVSAYSYIVTQCAANPQFPTCHGTYSDPTVAATMGAWMSYIACAGQVKMSEIGYAPLPPNLSQDVANSVSRITGQPPVVLSAANCPNPRFQGNLGVGASGGPDPYCSLASAPSYCGSSRATTNTPGGSNSLSTSGPSNSKSALTAGSGSGNGNATATSGSGSGLASGAGGGAGSNPGSLGASDTGVGVTGGNGTAGLANTNGEASAAAAVEFRKPSPVAYTWPIIGGLPSAPLLLLLALLVLPILRPGPFRRFFRRN